MWNDSFDDRGYLLDDLLLEAELMSELEALDFWEGYRDEELPDQCDWEDAA
jgi:hypothetical protein